MKDYVKKKDWYASCDPAGSMGNVHLLIKNETEARASNMALGFAELYGQPSVTLHLIH